MDFDEVTKFASENSIIFKNKKLNMGETSFHVWLPWLLTRITLADYYVRFSPPYTSIIMPSRGHDCIALHGYQNKIHWDIPVIIYMYCDDSIFSFHDFKVHVQIHQNLWIIKFSRTEIHFIFVFMSNWSYFPLLSMLKISKNSVTFETTLSCPQSGWLDVFIGLICR